MEVLKVVGTPFRPLSRIWCRHEADCLLKLAELGFANAPRLIRSTDISFTMEKIEGPSLRGRQPVDERVFLQVLDVVHHLHTLGFAHGNLRANNILISRTGEPFLIDFETCCRRSNPLFYLGEFSDDARLYSLWKSRVVKTVEGRKRTTFPRYVKVVMFVTIPVRKIVGAVKSLKKRWKRSRKASAEHLDPLPESAHGTQIPGQTLGTEAIAGGTVLAVDEPHAPATIPPNR